MRHGPQLRASIFGIGKRSLPVLLYHGVGPLPTGARVGPTVTPERFAAQIRWLADRKYQAIDPDTCASFIRGDGDLPDKAVLITFDDGYHNLTENALPVLLQHGMTATVFVVTDQIGGETTWDLVDGIPPARLMSIDEIREWAGKGISFGAHTRTHPDLRILRPDELRDEIAGSRGDLEGVLQKPVNAFAYPYGELTDAAHQAAREAYDVAFTVVEELNVPGVDPHLIGRTTLTTTDAEVDVAMAVRFGFSPRAHARKWAGRQRRRLARMIKA